MRTLLLMRGIPASGKSTYIKNNNLDDYTLSADYLRTLIQNPTMDENGKFGISQKNDSEVWKLLFQLLEERMKRGDFTVIDATHNNDKMMKKYKELADIYKYTIFYKEIDIPVETAIINNANRQEHKRVPENVIRRMHLNLKNCYIPKMFKPIQDINEINNFYVDNFDKYNKIIFIGDIHGCNEPLKEVLKDFSCDTAYVFLGDYIDRGIQNKEVMETLFNIMEYSNVYFLEGNHENVLLYFAKFQNTNKKSFEKFTRPQIEDMDKKLFKIFYKKLRQAMKISFHGQKYFVNHGGIPKMPQYLTLLSSNLLIKGIGDYDFDVDEQWDLNSKLGKNYGYMQIHGHRSLKDYETSISLEDGVEIGGNLKIFIAYKDGNTEIKYIKNNIFNEKLLDIAEPNENIQIKGLETGNEEINKMSKSRYIKVKRLENDICSLNFSETAFRKGIWNKFTTKARGLFVDKITGDVIARSYNKFFSYQEVSQTKSSNLKYTLKFPCNIYKKENGYLGIISHHKGELEFFTKTTNKSDMVNMFKKLFLSKVNEDELNTFKEYIIKNNISVVFEVVHEQDKHIIEYDSNYIFLLDCMENKLNISETNLDVQISKLHSNNIKQILKNNIEYKSKLLEIYNYEDLLKAIDYYDKDETMEGIVIEDSNGFLFKVKGKFYKTWKDLRALVQKVDKNNNYFDIRMLNNEVQIKFMTWFCNDYIKNTSPESLTLNIVELRKLYNEYVKGGCTNGD